jgi:hypothetical protein
MIIAAAAVAALSAASAAHAGNWSDDSSWSWSSASPSCGCQGGYQTDDYDQPGEWADSYDDEDYAPAYDYGHESYDYAPPAYGSSTYSYGYGRYRSYDYGRSYYVTPRYRSYSDAYGGEHRYRAPRTYNYSRSYQYTAPRGHTGFTRHDYGTHSSRDGERG